MEKGIRSLVPAGMESEITLHVSKIQNLLPPDSSLLIAANVNIFYTTGRFFRGYVWIPKEGSAVYFVIRPQTFDPGHNIIYIRKPEQIADQLRERDIHLPPRIGIEEDILSYSDVARLRKIFPDKEFFNSSPYIRGARMVKTPYEIDQMRTDGRRQVNVYSRISHLYHAGMTDIDLQIAIEHELRKEGSLGFTRVAGNLMEINMGSVLAGNNADNPSPYEFAMGGSGSDLSLPGGADGTVIRPGMTVMIDMNGAFNAYQTDMTRVWKLGIIPNIAYRAHDCSIEILRTLETSSTLGKPINELYFKALGIVERAGLSNYFMGHVQKSNFIGHGVGLELNEQPPVAPKCTVPLQENMTLALEPKFVIPGVGAVGVENTYVVRPYGLESLTPFSEAILNLR